MTPRPPARLALAATLVLVTVALGVRVSGADRAGAGSRSTGTPTVLVIGDSNLTLSTDVVEQRLREGRPAYSPVLHAAIGMGLKDNDAYWLPLLPQLLADARPACVVVALGANDDPVAADVEAFPQRLDTFLRALGTRTVLWATHSDNRPAPAPENARTINNDIVAAASGRARLHVVDFAAAVDRHPSWMSDDLLHLSPQGQRGFARIVRDAVRKVSWCGRRALRPAGLGPRSRRASRSSAPFERLARLDRVVARDREGGIGTDPFADARVADLRSRRSASSGRPSRSRRPPSSASA